VEKTSLSSALLAYGAADPNYYSRYLPYFSPVSFFLAFYQIDYLAGDSDMGTGECFLGGAMSQNLIEI
jgi:hypothetical protein